jgi:hypothetical protein
MPADDIDIEARPVLDGGRGGAFVRVADSLRVGGLDRSSFRLLDFFF